MNTQAHLLFNYVLLKKKEAPQYTWAILGGGLLPDLPMFLFYFYERLLMGETEGRIWSELYFTDFWQTFIDCFNSVPLMLLLLGVGVLLKSTALRLAALSMLLHVLGDLPLHREDAHRHFFPLSDYKFVSPVSYWDPDYGGLIIGTGEFVLFLGVSIWCWRQTTSLWARSGLVLGNFLYVGMSIYFAITLG